MDKNIKEITIIVLILLVIGGIVYYSKNDSRELPKNNIPQDTSKTSDIKYEGEKIIVEDSIIEGAYNTNSNDKNVLLISGSIKVSLNNASIVKSGDTKSSDNSSFYGINSAILVKELATCTINNTTIDTNASGSNGVFSYNSTINISNTNITTSKDFSGGIMVAGNGNIIADDLNIKTSGNSSAAIRSDRGGGTIRVNNGNYETNGKGSPTIYSTANIEVENAKLTSNHSEGIVIEGKNTVSIKNVNLIDNNDTLNGKSTTYKNIFIYQSMSGDATNGEATLTMVNSNITTNKGDTIFVTNTDASIYLENNTFVNNDSIGNFINITKSAWGIDGLNGGVVNVRAVNQNMIGNIIVDEISVLNMNMSDQSYYEGTINGNNSGGKIEIVLDKKSKIKLTGDSYVSAINDANRAYTNIDFNGYKLYVDGISIN